MKLASALLVCLAAASTRCASASEPEARLLKKKGKGRSKRESNDEHIREHLWDATLTQSQFMTVEDEDVEEEATGTDAELMQNNQLAQASLEPDCLTVEQCRQKHASLKSTGEITGYFYVDDYVTKGCFRKNDNVFFGTGGTLEEMVEVDLPGIRERLYCAPEVPEATVPETEAPTEKPTRMPTREPSLPPSPAPTTKSPTLPPSPAPTTKAPSLEPTTQSPSGAPSPEPTTKIPTKAPSPEPTTNSPSGAPSTKPTPSPTERPTQDPTPSPTTSELTTEPTSVPSAMRSEVPSAVVSNMPSVEKSAEPSVAASGMPSVRASEVPSAVESDMPSVAASDMPSVHASEVPSAVVSNMPSVAKSAEPSVAASDMPSVHATDVPSAVESDMPSVAKSAEPSVAASDMPSVHASDVPSAQPTTKDPTLEPSAGPSSSPTQSPTEAPTESWPVSLGGTIWNDANEDGIMDDSEERASGVVVQAKSCGNDRTVAFSFSRSDGTYRLNDIGPPGCYYLTFLPSEGYTVATPASGRTDDLILGSGESNFAMNAAVVFAPPTPEPTEAPIAVDESASVVWRDLPTLAPSVQPVPSIPTVHPSPAPTVRPTPVPVTTSPTIGPSASPTTDAPSSSPITADPTGAPSASPTTKPSSSPVTADPTMSPSGQPSTADPSKQPSAAPVTSSPTEEPSAKPTTESPTPEPSRSPFVERGDGLIQQTPTTATPTKEPSVVPVTAGPTKTPTSQPTASPSKRPSPFPTRSPSKAPTLIANIDDEDDLGFVLGEESLSMSMMPDLLTASPQDAPTKKPSTSSQTALPTLSPVVAQSDAVDIDEEEDLGFLINEGSMSMSMPQDAGAGPTKKPSTAGPSLGSTPSPSSSPVESLSELAPQTTTASELPKMKFSMFETEGRLSDEALADLTSAVNTFYNAQLADFYNTEGNSFQAIDLVTETQTSVTGSGRRRLGRRFQRNQASDSSKGLLRRRRNTKRRLDEDLVFLADDDRISSGDDSLDFDSGANGIARPMARPTQGNTEDLVLSADDDSDVGDDSVEIDGGASGIAHPMQGDDEGLVLITDGDDAMGDDTVDFASGASPLQGISGTKVVYGGNIEFLGDAPPSSNVADAITFVSRENSEELVAAIVDTGNAELSNVYLVLVEEDDSVAMASPDSESYLAKSQSSSEQEAGKTNPAVIVAVIVGAATLSLLVFVFATRSRRRDTRMVDTSFGKAISNDLDASIDDNIQSTSGEEYEVEAGRRSTGGGLQSVADMNCKGTMTIEKEDESAIPKSWLMANAVAEKEDDSALPKPFLKALQGQGSDSSIIMVNGAEASLRASSVDDTSTENSTQNGGGFPTRNDGAFPTNGDWSHIGTVKDEDLSSTKPSVHEIAKTYSQETGESKSSLNQFISDLVWLENKIAEEGTKEAVEINIKEDSTITQSERDRDIQIKDSLSYECDSFVGSLSPRSMSDEESTIRTTTSSLAANSQAMSIVCRDCYIPAGNLDIEISSTKDGPMVKSINDPSLEGHLNVGDLIMALDDRDTRSLSAEQLATILSSRASFQRKLTLLHFGGAR